MKKIFLLIFVLFFLTGCFNFKSISSSKDSLKSKSWLELYSTGSFKIAIPAAWDKLNSNNNIIPKPIYWKIVLVALSKNQNLGFYNNLVILSQDLNNKKITSSEYSILNNNLSKSSYLEYKLLKEKDIVFPNGKKSKLFVFKARYNDKSPKAVFIQSAQVCDDTWYLLTIWLNQMVENTEKYEKIIETFDCTNVQ